MSADVLDGRALAKQLLAEAAERASHFYQTQGRRPQLSAVQVGDAGEAAAYVRSKVQAAEKCEIDFQVFNVPANAGESVLHEHLRAIVQDNGVDGVMLELPLPTGYDVDALRTLISIEKDADGFSTESLGRLAAGAPTQVPATPRAVMALIEMSGVDPSGRRALVIGRSTSVGLPTALLLLRANSTVSIAHSRTHDLASLVRDADILVAAAGRPGLVTAEMVRPGAVVIDVGTTWLDMARDQRDSEASAMARASRPLSRGASAAARVQAQVRPHGGHLVGDVAQGAANVAAALSPVPGGVGPVTTAMVMLNLMDLAEARLCIST